MIDAALEPLCDMLGQSTVGTLLGRTLVTNWHDEPWILGSYTNARPGCLKARAALREPWFDRLHYAGEASAPAGWQATVAGAYLAGRAAARSVIQRLETKGC